MSCWPCGQRMKKPTRAVDPAHHPGAAPRRTGSRTSLGIPRDLETIILKAISHDAGQRYPSAEAMADDLRCFLEDRPIRARRVGPVERLGRWCRRNKSLASLTGTTLFLLVLVAVVASIGYVRTKRALQGEACERAKAEANAGLAIEALDRMFERFSPTRDAGSSATLHGRRQGRNHRGAQLADSVQGSRGAAGRDAAVL